MLSASWTKIIGLSALQGAIALTWLIYNIYLPKLLISYGFSPKLAVTLLIVENAIAVILEPLFGSLSDRTYQWIATKLGLVSFGVILTSALTILISTIFVFRDLFTAATWILPSVLVAWAMAMTIFRTPAISLIGRYAFASELPIAMSFLTVVGGFIGALKPVVQDFILSLGAPAAFTIASVFLLAATALLRYFDPPIPNNLIVADRQPIDWMRVSLLVVMGAGMAWGVRCLFETLPKVLKLNFPQFDPVILMVIISLAISASALPAGIFANKYGNRKAMLIGIGITAISPLSIVFVPATIAISVIAIICCFSWMTNGAIPLAINVLPPDRSGLAVGLYFSGFTAGISSFSSLFNSVTNLTPFLGASYGTIGAIITGLCVVKLGAKKELIINN